MNYKSTAALQWYVNGNHTTENIFRKYFPLNPSVYVRFSPTTFLFLPPSNIFSSIQNYPFKRRSRFLVLAAGATALQVSHPTVSLQSDLLHICSFCHHTKKY